MNPGQSPGLAAGASRLISVEGGRIKTPMIQFILQYQLLSDPLRRLPDAKGAASLSAIFSLRAVALQPRAHGSGFELRSKPSARCRVADARAR